MYVKDTQRHKKICVLLIYIIKWCVADCSFRLNGDMPNKEPLFLQKSDRKYEIIHSTGPDIKLKSSKDYYLACSGPRNSFTEFCGKNMIKVKCSSGKRVKVELETAGATCSTPSKGKKKGTKSTKDQAATCTRKGLAQTYDIDKLGCQKIIEGDMTATTEKCGNDVGKRLKVGFKIREGDECGEDVWVDLYEICFSESTASVVFTHHSLKTTTDREDVGHRPCFRSIGFDPSVAPAKAYLLATQKERFTKLFRDKGLSDKYTDIANGKYLSRGHVTPDADFFCAALRNATYLYANVVPTWQLINGGNWLRIETRVREINKMKDLIVYTGIHGILEKIDNEGKDVKMYLGEKNKIEVPKWLWKVVISSTGGNKKEGIAFVTLNDPFADKVENIERLCDDVCKKAKFNDENFKKLDQGYTYCCEIDKLKAKVSTISEIEDVGALMVKPDLTESLQSLSIQKKKPSAKTK